MQFALKIIISSAIIIVVSEIAKRSTMIAAILASLPLTSMLAIIWLYYDTGDTVKIAQLSTSIFYAVFPSLVFLILLPLLLKKGIGFISAFLLSVIVMVLFYLLFIFVVNRLAK